MYVIPIFQKQNIHWNSKVKHIPLQSLTQEAFMKIIFLSCFPRFNLPNLRWMEMWSHFKDESGRVGCPDRMDDQDQNLLSGWKKTARGTEQWTETKKKNIEDGNSCWWDPVPVVPGTGDCLFLPFCHSCLHWVVKEGVVWRENNWRGNRKGSTCFNDWFVFCSDRENGIETDRLLV